MVEQPAHLRPTPRTVKVAAIQMSCGWDAEANRIHAERLVREAAAAGAQVILLPELFETPYFCIEQDARHLRLASTVEENLAVRRFRAVARELRVVLPISLFERAGPVYFNSVAMIDADGAVLGVYRKSHIPNGPGYQEKNYFSPGDSGFKVWPTRFGRIGVGICWDQWFPETARAMVLGGAQLLLYPTAIGSEPPPALPVDSRAHWQRTQQGHAAANLTPLIAAIGGQSNFANLTFTVHHSTFLYGDFVNAVLSFVVIAAVVFFAVAKPVTGFLGRLGRLPQEQPMHPCPFCLTSVPVAATRCAQCTSELEAGAS